MIISNNSDGIALVSGTTVDVTQEASILFGSMLEKTPEVLLAVIATYSDEIENLNPEDYGKKLDILYGLAGVAKKCFKEGKMYGN